VNFLFAAPHVAGACALMLSADKTLTFDQILTKLQTTAFKGSVLTTGDRSCGVSPGGWPNNVYGDGRINVRAAMGIPATPPRPARDPSVI